MTWVEDPGSREDMPLLDRAVTQAATAGGAALRLFLTALARLRPALKPLHAHGSVVPGTVLRHGLTTPVGVPWLDRAGEDEVLVRLSPGAGLPAPLPDVQGLAIRLRARGEHPADLLFASTGLSGPGRFLLLPRRHAEHVPYGTLLPYRTPTGLLLLAARPASPGSTGDVAFHLLAARPLGEWHRFATLLLPPEPTRWPDELVSFDPVLNALPGLEFPAWAARLREGAYAAARRERRRREELAVSDPSDPSESAPA